MGQQKGRTNNPFGRPPKERALTDLVSHNLTGMLKVGKKEQEVKLIFAKTITDLLLFGKAELPRYPGDKDIRVLVLEAEGYVEFVKWWLVHAEGSVKPDQNFYLNQINNQIDFGKISADDFVKIGEIIEPALLLPENQAGG
jgi:hypothetical protein